ncbi:MAG TPA: CHAT domain-containing protein, partial [Longimicrobium sp.]|nr:CHAT domain-containing protein [Longimicrobium sp.]
DEDVREIREKVLAAEHRDALDFDYRLAARPDDLIQALNETRPQVVHFSGHGRRNGLVLASADGTRAHTADAAALKQLFEVFRGDIRVVFLNACLSLPQAQVIADVVGCAIGTRGTIADPAAITFGASFYRAIAFGKSVQEAYAQARTALALEHPDDQECPELVARSDVDPAKLVLVSPGDADPGTREPAQAAAPPRAGDPREELAARARRWIGMVAVVAAFAFGAIFVNDDLRALVPIVGAQDRTPVNRLFEPAGPVTPGDLTKAKDLYTTRNYAVAFPLFQRLAEDENVEAMGYLGFMYLHGEGTAPNESLAELWLREAIKKDRDARAMHGLGIWYEMGSRYHLAKHWYEKAVEEHDYAPAMSSLAEMYAHGRYVKASRDSAIAWYQKAASAGFVDALVGIGEVYQRGVDGPRDPGAALRYYRVAADRGSARGMDAIGRMYQEGDGVVRDHKMARYWYQKALEAGSTVAAANLALLKGD